MRWHIAALFALLIALYLPRPTMTEADAGVGAPVLFAETGHTLAYTLRDFYEQRGGRTIIGLPISEVFLDQGYPTQYFEHARLEWHADAGEVRIADIGSWAAQSHLGEPAFQPAGAPSDDPIARLSGHTLGGAFRIFYSHYGGWPTFGAPISEQFQELNPQGGQLYTVQYFERARFELHPELPWPANVALGQLGRQYLAANPAPEQALRAVRSAAQAWAGVRITRVAIPRVGIDVAVEERGVSLGAWDVPPASVGHLWPISAFPGSRGNIILVGHANYRDRIFNHLPWVRAGDAVDLYVEGTLRRYIVRDLFVVDTKDTWVLNPTEEEVLTLITCTPEGDFSRRLIVHAVPAIEDRG